VVRPKREVRVLLVGFSAEDLPFERQGDKIVLPRGYKATSWSKFSNETLYDYDVLILNLATLNKDDEIVKASWKKDQLTKQLEAIDDSLVVVFSYLVIGAYGKWDGSLIPTNYSLLPKHDKIKVKCEYSERYEFVGPSIFAPIFRRYYRGQRFYFASIPPDSIILAKNRVGAPLAFMYSYGKGKVIVLPSVSSKKEVLRFLFNRIIPEFAGINEPEWITKIPFLDEKELLEKKAEIEKKLESYRRWKLLLYGIGFPLQEIVGEALRAMRLKVWEPKIKNMHDFEAELAMDTIGAIEVTGSKGLISHEPLNQLLSYVSYLREEVYSDKQIKGVLIVNPQHIRPPEERDPIGLKRAAIDIAERCDFCVLKTIDLYALLQQYMLGEITTDDIKEILRKTRGVFRLDDAQISKKT